MIIDKWLNYLMLFMVGEAVETGAIVTIGGTMLLFCFVAGWPIRLIDCVNIKSIPPKIREIMMEIDITTKVS